MAFGNSVFDSWRFFILLHGEHEEDTETMKDIYPKSKFPRRSPSEKIQNHYLLCGTPCILGGSLSNFEIQYSITVRPLSIKTNTLPWQNTELGIHHIRYQVYRRMGRPSKKAPSYSPVNTVSRALQSRSNLSDCRL